MEKKKEYVVSFNEDIKGWTSFHSWRPDWMVSMNNQMYSFKNGNLYLQFDPDAPRNTFYGELHPSRLSVMVNASPSTIKELLTVSLEGNKPWNMIIKAFVSSEEDFIKSSIKDNEFVIEEGIWGTYARRNEDEKQVDSASMYGIGRVSTINGTVIEVNGFSHALTAGDVLYNSDLQSVGSVISHNESDNMTTIVLTTVNNINVGDYILGGKDPRIEGGNLRGYTILFDMDITSSEKVELFALNANVIKSYPSS